MPTLEEQISMAGLGYGRRHDISYRTGLVLQVLGAAVLAVLYPLESPFYTAGIMLFETGVLLSAIYLLVWMSWVKKMILGSVLTGLVLQVAGCLVGPEQYAGSIIIAGIGFVCVGAAGMAGKEAYLFRLPGRLAAHDDRVPSHGYRKSHRQGEPHFQFSRVLGTVPSTPFPHGQEAQAAACSRHARRMYGGSPRKQSLNFDLSILANLNLKVSN